MIRGCLVRSLQCNYRSLPPRLWPFHRHIGLFGRYSYGTSPSEAALAAEHPDFELTPEATRTAFQPEISALNTHASLLNQTTPDQLLSLADINPMMQIFRGLADRQLGHLVVRTVLRALKQTAKDSSFTLRSLPLVQRASQQNILFASLRDALEEVSSSLASEPIRDAGQVKQAWHTLFGAFEIVDPFAGVEVYQKLAPAYQSLVGSDVIPCMVKSKQSFSQVRIAFERDTQPDDRAAATMAWACLRYGEIDAAQVLFDDIGSGSPPAPVWGFLLDAFIGDAPAELAMRTFTKYDSHTPHHAAMSRFLVRLWADNKQVPLQLSVFQTYLSRLAVPSELDIKTVATTVVHNVVSGSISPDDTLDHVQRLCLVYDEYVADHTVFLNVVLTQIAERWTSRDEARTLVLAVLANYGPQDDRSVVSFRVRLNALENLSNTDSLAKELWAARTSLPRLPSVQKWDWLALVRATNASEWFVEEWTSAGRPFERDVRRFSASRGYRI